jgi:hypothetical protein
MNLGSKKVNFIFRVLCLGWYQGAGGSFLVAGAGLAGMLTLLLSGLCPSLFVPSSCVPYVQNLHNCTM